VRGLACCTFANLADFSGLILSTGYCCLRECYLGYSYCFSDRSICYLRWPSQCAIARFDRTTTAKSASISSKSALTLMLHVAQMNRRVVESPPVILRAMSRPIGSSGWVAA